MARGEFRPMKYLQINFFQRFAAIGGLAFAITVMVTHGYYASQTERQLKSRLLEKAIFINNFLAYTFSSALQYKDDVTLLQVIDQLEKDPDILSVVVGDDHGEIRYTAQPNKIGEEIDDPTMRQVYQSAQASTMTYTTSGGEAMALVAPLKINGRAKPLGVVRLDVTFKHVEEQLQKSRDSFLLYAIGLFMFGMTMTMTALQSWVSRPLVILKNYLRSVSPFSAELTLPEGSDELGQLNAAINEVILKFKGELQTQAMMQTGQVSQEAELIQQLLASLNPEHRVIMSDKDNLILGDSDPTAPTTGSHLLDLMQDAAFATLVGTAFQQAGQPVTGRITLNEEPYNATILRMPESFSKGVRTLILLSKEKSST
jgi:hypothetical protein